MQRMLRSTQLASTPMPCGRTGNIMLSYRLCHNNPDNGNIDFIYVVDINRTINDGLPGESLRFVGNPYYGHLK